MYARLFGLPLLVAVCVEEQRAADASLGPRCVNLAREVRSLLAEQQSSGQLIVAVGAVEAAIEALIPALPAALVVVAAGQVTGARAKSICVRSGVPLLVARAWRGPGVLLATDLAIPSLPVLRLGAAFARRIGATVIGAHNVESPLPTHSFEWAHAGVEVIESAQRKRLAKALSETAPGAVARVSTAFDTAKALAEAGAESKSDVLVVGARRRWFEWWSGATTSARVVDEASCSVLLLPVGADEMVLPWS